MRKMQFAEYESPVGKLLLRSNGEALTGLWIGVKTDEQLGEDPVLLRTKMWLDAYFRGERPTMDIPVFMEGTAFQKAVWDQLLKIPYGKTCTYGELAAALAKRFGKEKMSAQAVGQAVGRNPINILVPCHRVVGTRGALTGYGGGLPRKIRLLQQEGHIIEKDMVK